MNTNTGPAQTSGSKNDAIGPVTSHADGSSAMISHQARCAAACIPSPIMMAAPGENYSPTGKKKSEKLGKTPGTEPCTEKSPAETLEVSDMEKKSNDMDFAPEDLLKQAFRDAGKEYGYDNVGAEFVAFREFKVRWQRSYKWVSFNVSDYMMDAPGEVIEALARTLFGRIAGKKDVPYSEEMIAWSTSKDFVRCKQPVYLRRSSGLTRSPKGEVRDLEDSMSRLVDAGLAEKDPDLVLTWMKEKNLRKVGYCSVLMKVIAISPALDNAEVPEFVLDYVVYHEYLHASGGMKVFGRPHDPDFKRNEKKYPKYAEAEHILQTLGIDLE
jgi:hypothetical protein